LIVWVELTDIVVLSKDQVQDLLTMDEAIVAMEDVFAAASRGEADSVGVLHIDAKKYSGGWGIKPGYLESRGYVGVKMSCGYPNNISKGVPTIMGAILLADAKDGTPLAVLDGLYVTAVRTGATGGVAAKHLARKDSETVGVIGAGTQGRMQVLALKGLFPLKEVKAYDVDKTRLEAYAKEMGKMLGVKVTRGASAEDAIRGSDIVITVTPSKSPYVNSDWIEDGMHMNAFGADGLGKRELDGRIYKRAKLVTDNIEVAMEKKLFDRSDVYAELGEVITGKKKGRTSKTELTVFDSTGVGIQDVAAAATVYEKAKKLGVGKTIKLF
jgi:alanine dehydrogenase